MKFNTLEQAFAERSTKLISSIGGIRRTKSPTRSALRAEHDHYFIPGLSRPYI